MRIVDTQLILAQHEEEIEILELPDARWSFEVGHDGSIGIEKQGYH